MTGDFIRDRPFHSHIAKSSLYSALAGSLNGIIATATGRWSLGNLGPRILYAAMTLATALMILPFVGLAKAVSHSRSSRGPGLD